MDTSDVDRIRKLQASRLKEARVNAGFKSGRVAALRFHWPVVTYNKHEAGERGIGRAAKKYARKFKVDEAWLLGLREEKTSQVQGVPVVGEAAVGRWQEIDVASRPEPEGPVRVSTPLREAGQDDEDRFAIRLADASMNREFPQGAYAICVYLDSKTAKVSDFVIGDILYIERKRNDLMEMTLRRVTEFNGAGRMQLSTHSTDPALRQVVTFPSTRADEKIRLIGKVVGKYADYTPG